MANIDFEPTKLKQVKIELVVPNTWNPKEKDTDEYKRVKESVFQKGLRGAIVVRQHPTEKGKYEILDGQQRFTAAKELGYEDIYVYDEGEVSDQEARELTIWYQQQVPFDKISEAYLVTEMVTLYGTEGLELPYTDNEFKEFEELAKFDFDQYDDTAPKDDDFDGEARSLKLVMGKEAYDIIMKAIKHVQDHNDNVSEARGLELICADYLGGVSDEPEVEQ